MPQLAYVMPSVKHKADDASVRETNKIGTEMGQIDTYQVVVAMGFDPQSDSKYNTVAPALLSQNHIGGQLGDGHACPLHGHACPLDSFLAIPRNTLTRQTRDRFVVHALAWWPDTLKRELQS